MKVREQRREEAIERMADHLLQAGMADASLRPLARAAGTSDRMLLYYFASRDELVGATLERLATRLRAVLDSALPIGVRLSRGDLLDTLWTATGSIALRPYMRLWVELAAAASGGQEPERGIAGKILDGFAAWVCDHLDSQPGTQSDRAAAALLATLDGALLFDTIGRRDLAEAAIRTATEQARHLIENIS